MQTSAQNSLDLLKTIKPINLDNIKITDDEKRVLRDTLNDAKSVNRKIGHQMIANLSGIIDTTKHYWYGMN